MFTLNSLLDWWSATAMIRRLRGLVDPKLLKSDLIILENLLQDIDEVKRREKVIIQNLECAVPTSSTEPSEPELLNGRSSQEGVLSPPEPPTSKNASTDTRSEPAEVLSPRDDKMLRELRALNDPDNDNFEPTVFLTWDLAAISLPFNLEQLLLHRYIGWAKTVARNPTDIVMVTHLILHFSTSVPSAMMLFWQFNYLHGLLHVMMQVWFAGTYTLMMHQHIHMRGILSKQYSWLDHAFPYITDPLHGHTWNSYYYHHVKHHHVESNGPNDLSSTIRYQRDDFWHFIHYFCKFFFFIWFDLPLYFVRKGELKMAMRATIFELGNYLFIYIMATCASLRATIFVLIIPLLIMRIGLMAGNWGQHAFVDEVEPTSDFRSSVTLIDVASNRFSYNDGYHTSHHLNPHRHWREHPVSFLQQKHIYVKEGALVFQNIDYLMITIKLLSKDYTHLAKCLVPMGSQIGKSIPELAKLLQSKTRRFTEAEIKAKFGSKSNSRFLMKRS